MAKPNKRKTVTFHKKKKRDKDLFSSLSDYTWIELINTYILVLVRVMSNMTGQV